MSATPQPRARSKAAGLRAAGAALASGAAIALLILLGERKFGLLGVLLPLVLVGVVAALRAPFFTLCLTLGLTLLCEGTTVNLPVMHELYRNLYGGIEPVDLLVTLTFFAVTADLLRRRRQPRLPGVPALALMLVALATIAGVAVGHDAGISIKQALLSINPIVELVVMTFAVYNLDLTEDRLVTLIRWCVAMAVVKAIMGLVVMSLSLSADVYTNTTITYYEPTANWLELVTMFGLLAAALGGGRGRELAEAALRRLGDAGQGLRARLARRGPYERPLILAPSRSDRRRSKRAATAARDQAPDGWAPLRRGPSGLTRRQRSATAIVIFGLVAACLVLSYRRSFWIGGALGLLVLIPLASTPRKRLMIPPAVLLAAAAIWALQAVDKQAVEPIVKRATSLQPSHLTTNAQDRYRLDEEANVIAEIKAAPLTGLGVQVPWVASVRSLGVEHVEGRLYVDFGLLWWWLKLGILGAAAYLGLLLAMATMAFRTWRRHAITEFRSFGLASLCAVLSLMAIETTAAFTGVDPRFSVLFGAQFGLLAVLSDRGSTLLTASHEPLEPAAPGPSDGPRSRPADEAWERYQRALAAYRRRTGLLP